MHVLSYPYSERVTLKSSLNSLKFLGSCFSESVILSKRNKLQKKGDNFFLICKYFFNLINGFDHIK